MNRSQYKLKIGLFGIGLEAYWSQFEGLKSRLESYLKVVEEMVSSSDAEICNLGMVDTPEQALEAGHECRRKDVDIIFLYVTTYAVSSTVLPVIRRANVPVIILNLAPGPSIDYQKFNALNDRTKMTGEWLAYCSACPIPEIINVFNRAGIPVNQVTGFLSDEEVTMVEIREWIEAAKVMHSMAHNRLGLMGHYYGGMLDIYTDLTQQLIQFGGHIELLEVDELTQLRKEVDAQDIPKRMDEIKELFDVREDCQDEDLVEAARTSLALDALVKKHDLGSLAYYYKGLHNENGDTIASIIVGNSMLTAKGIPVAGEYEVKNVQAMKILDLMGCGGSFTEYYAMDYEDDIVLMGHDGPGHMTIAEGKVRIKPLDVYHGKVGRGLSVEMSVKYGKVTLLSVVNQPDGRLMLLMATGVSEPGPILEIGNTNSRYRFNIGARQFVESWNQYGPAHHCAIGVGDVTGVLEKLGKLLNMKTVRVC